tara:strand:- start:3405 stop:3725 length:321 start_codon:yes stop_codon:yes gene_type:complete
MTKRIKIRAVLGDIEAELRQLQMWQSEAPPSEALASTQPFCVDTLSLPQWLQFVFLPRLQQLIELNLPLPHGCAIAPMAEEYFKALPVKASSLLQFLRRVDSLLSI